MSMTHTGRMAGSGGGWVGRAAAREDQRACPGLHAVSIAMTYKRPFNQHRRPHL